MQPLVDRGVKPLDDRGDGADAVHKAGESLRLALLAMRRRQTGSP
jgi:hypothetical protein